MRILCSRIIIKKRGGGGAPDYFVKLGVAQPSDRPLHQSFDGSHRRALASECVRGTNTPEELSNFKIARMQFTNRSLKTILMFVQVFSPFTLNCM